MRKVLVVCLVAGALALGLFVPRGSSAPASAGRATVEYGELRYTANLLVREGQPGQPKPQPVRQVTANWYTAAGAVEAKEWKDLGDKLRAPGAKDDASPLALRLRVLDRLGADGWEVYEHERPANGFGGSTETWMLRRRLP
jgi:hypothetical protein